MQPDKEGNMRGGLESDYESRHNLVLKCYRSSFIYLFLTVMQRIVDLVGKEEGRAAGV